MFYGGQRVLVIAIFNLLLEAVLQIQKRAATIQKWILLFLFTTGGKDLR